jgi:hypothetical protein
MGFESPLTSDDFGVVGNRSVMLVAAQRCFTWEGRPSQPTTRMNEKRIIRDTGNCSFCPHVHGRNWLNGVVPRVFYNMTLEAMSSLLPAQYTGTLPPVRGWASSALLSYEQTTRQSYWRFPFPTLLFEVASSDSFSLPA